MPHRSQANVTTIKESAKDFLKVLDAYRNPPKTERGLDIALFAYFFARFSNVTRQFNVIMPQSQAPHRIDFRFGGTNPILLEFALRPRSGGGHLLAPNNKSELRKLSRIPPSRARVRVLLVIDLRKRVEPLDRLKRNYENFHLGRGNFPRHGVRVVYVHPQQTETFFWVPYRAQA